eukprot:comp21433_c0_seq1/m.29558 comp21433_c0_seq1/g.29558  ORF comp21433_c0_seq1/g.29558 comp21433_c0_seq1/m.29558 type:complete len:107 (-) comp21433_c0_seq1:82-402(-)
MAAPQAGFALSEIQGEPINLNNLTEVLGLLDADSEGTPAAAGPERQRRAPTLQTMSARHYLDATVVPLLLEGLTALAKERPQDPVQYLADFLVRNKTRRPGVDPMI